MKENDKYKHVVSTIDILLKYKWSELLIRKSGSDVVKTVRIILNKQLVLSLKQHICFNQTRVVNLRIKSSRTIKRHIIKMYYMENKEECLMKFSIRN